MAIEIELEQLLEVQPWVVPDDQDVSGSILDIVATSIEDADTDHERIALVPRAHPGEDEVNLWFG